MRKVCVTAASTLGRAARAATLSEIFSAVERHRLRFLPTRRVRHNSQSDSAADGNLRPYVARYVRDRSKFRDHPDASSQGIPRSSIPALTSANRQHRPRWFEPNTRHHAHRPRISGALALSQRSSSSRPHAARQASDAERGQVVAFSRRVLRRCRSRRRIRRRSATGARRSAPWRKRRRWRCG
jgi:hypothetical protein